jgi:ribonuclease P protein component
LPQGCSLTVLRRRAEFVALAKEGKKWVTPGLIVQAGTTPKTETGSAIRYGLTASSKIGNAVIRNRARRRMRALANEILPLHAEAGRDYVLIARATTPSRDFAELRQDLTTALHKLGVWREGA